MKKFVVLFRAINVGGNNKLPMKELIPLLEKAGFQKIRYYIQTGNIILSASVDPTVGIQRLVARHFNFMPEVITIEAVDFINAQKNCPYDASEGKLIHLYFCMNTAKLELTKIEKYLAENEQYSLINNVLYLYAPEGIGRSKFVSNITACLGTPATGRNMNTITKISMMLDND